MQKTGIKKLWFMTSLFISLGTSSPAGGSAAVEAEPQDVSPLHYCMPRTLDRETIPATQTTHVPPTKVMLIFNDESELGINTPFTNELAIALYQIQQISAHSKAYYYILTTTSLLRNVIAARTFATSVYNQVIAKIEKKRDELRNEHISEQEKLRHIKQIATLDLEENSLLNTQITFRTIAEQLAVYTYDVNSWIAYEINQFWYLLVPTAIAEPSSKIPLDDFELGLKISQRKKLLHADLQKLLLANTENKSAKEALNSVFSTKYAGANAYAFPAQVLQQDQKFIFEPLAYKKFNQQKVALLKWISPLFLTKDDYTKNEEIKKMPQWAFRIIGHGGDTSLANLSIDDFRTMLNFFNSGLLTRICIVSSCFAAGINAEKVYLQNRDSLTYSFPIILEGTIDSAIFMGTNDPLIPIITSLSGPIRPYLSTRFDEFALLITKSISILYKKLLPSLLLSLQQTIQENTSDLLNAPLFRPPNRDIFLPVFRIATITKKIASNNTTLYIKHMYDEINEKSLLPLPFILLTTEMIPCDININDINQKTQFIVGATKAINYRFKRIIGNATLGEMVYMFRGGYSPSRMFLIDNITLNNITKYTQVLIYTEDLLNQKTRCTFRNTESNELMTFYAKSYFVLSTGKVFTTIDDVRYLNPLEASAYQEVLKKFPQWPEELAEKSAQSQQGASIFQEFYQQLALLQAVAAQGIA